MYNERRSFIQTRIKRLRKLQTSVIIPFINKRVRFNRIVYFFLNILIFIFLIISILKVNSLYISPVLYFFLTMQSYMVFDSLLQISGYSMEIYQYEALPAFIDESVICKSRLFQDVFIVKGIDFDNQIVKLLDQNNNAQLVHFEDFESLYVRY